jgi:molybdate transport system regulatory protein
MTGSKNDWNLKISVWVYHNGEKVLGPGRVELLGHIQRHRSISAAAKQMSMSYRRAWSLVRSMNEAAGEQLVELAAGGSGGGGATVTERGKEALALYQKLIKQLNRTAFRVAGLSTVA